MPSQQRRWGRPQYDPKRAGWRRSRGAPFGEPHGSVPADEQKKDSSVMLIMALLSNDTRSWYMKFYFTLQNLIEITLSWFLVIIWLLFFFLSFFLVLMWCNFAKPIGQKGLWCQALCATRWLTFPCATFPDPDDLSTSSIQRSAKPASISLCVRLITSFLRGMPFLCNDSLYLVSTWKFIFHTEST